MLRCFALLFVSAFGVATPGALARADDEARVQDELNIPLDAKVASLDPAKISESHEYAIAEDLFEGLTTTAADGTVVPGVATSWQSSRDGLIWTFHLRKNARWSDGASVTARDFVYSLRREVSLAVNSPSASTLEPILNAQEILNGSIADPCALGVRAKDAHTLVIELKRPLPWLPMLLTHYAAFPVSKHAVEAYGDHWAQPGRLVSNGPYVLSAWTANGEILLTRNSRFHAASGVRIRAVRFLPGPPEGDARRMLEAGKFDVVSLTGGELAEAEAHSPDRLVRQQELATAFLAVNRTRAALADERVRRALSMVIDRDRLIHDIEQARHVSGYEFVAPAISRLVDYHPQSASWSRENIAQRITEARALIAEARGGASEPLSVHLAYLDNPHNRSVAAAIAEMWNSSLGVETMFEPVPAADWLKRLASRDFDLAAVTWDPDFADPISYLGMFRQADDPSNFGGFAEPFFNAQLDRAGATTNSAERFRFLEGAERRLIDTEGVIPLQHGDLELLVSRRLKGFVANPLARHPARYLSLENRK